MYVSLRGRRSLMGRLETLGDRLVIVVTHVAVFYSIHHLHDSQLKFLLCF